MKKKNKKEVRRPFNGLNWADDFAEYVTFYYSIRSLGITYRITVKRNGEPVYNYEPMRSERIIVRSRLLDKELVKLLIFIP